MGEVICYLELPASHPLWESLRASHFTLRKAAQLAQMVQLTTGRAGVVAVAGPDLDQAQLAQVAARLNQHNGAPLVLVTRGSLPPAPPRGPIYGYLHESASPEQACATLTAAQLLHHQALELSGQIKAAKKELENRKLIERAKGMIMMLQQLSESEAHRWLVREAMNRRVRLEALACQVIAYMLTNITQNKENIAIVDIKLT